MEWWSGGVVEWWAVGGLCEAAGGRMERTVGGLCETAGGRERTVGGLCEAVVTRQQNADNRINLFAIHLFASRARCITGLT